MSDSPSIPTALWRGKLLIASCAVLTTAAAWAGWNFAAPSYVAESSLLIKLGREFIAPGDGAGARPTTMYRLSEMINSEIELLESRQLVYATLETVGVEAIYPDIAAEEPDETRRLSVACAAFRDDLTVLGVPDSSVIKVRFAHPEPQVAAATVNALVDAFTTMHLDMFRESRSEFLETEVASLRAGLGEAELDLSTYAEARGIYDLPRQRELLLQQRSTLELEQREINARLTQLRHLAPSIPLSTAPRADADGGLGNPVSLDARLLAIREQITELRLRLLPDGVTSELNEPLLSTFASAEAAHTELLRLRIHRQEVVSTYGESQRQVETVDDQIALVERFLIAGLLDDLEAALTRDATLASDLARVDTRLAELRAAEAGLRQRERLRTAAENQYSSVLASFEDARLADRLDEQGMISVRLIDRAAAPVSAAGMPLRTRLVLGAMAGIAAGMLFVLFSSGLAAR